MSILMQELARDRQRRLLAEAAAGRLAAEAARLRRASGEVGRGRAAWRVSAGRRLIALGSRLAGAGGPVGYRPPAAGQGAR